jgi:hypothetical protein
MKLSPSRHLVVLPSVAFVEAVWCLISGMGAGHCRSIVDLGTHETADLNESRLSSAQEHVSVFLDQARVVDRSQRAQSEGTSGEKLRV